MLPLVEAIDNFHGILQMVRTATQAWSKFLSQHALILLINHLLLHSILILPSLLTSVKDNFGLRSTSCFLNSSYAFLDASDASSASLACAFRMSYHPRAPRPVLLNTNQRLPSTSSAPFVMANEECLASIATAWTLLQRCISVLPSYLSLSPLLSTLEFCDSVEIPGSFLRTLNEPFYDLHPVSLRNPFSLCAPPLLRPILATALTPRPGS